MKQIENRYKDAISIICHPTFKEKLRLLFCNRFRIIVDFSNDIEGGMEKTHYTQLETKRKHQ